MKKFFLVAIVLMAVSYSVNAQDKVSVSIADNAYSISGGKTASKEVAAYLQKSLQNLPDYQSVTVSKKKADGTVEVLGGKGAEAFGHGIEVYLGAGFMTDAVTDGVFITPEVGLRYRHDWKRVSLAFGASALSRQYNAEAIDAGKRYFSYGTDATFHVNLMRLGQSEHVLNIFAQGGYLFGMHRKAVEELNGAPLYHNGSGLTYGGGLEYRWQIHATGNAMTLRAGYKNTPNTFVNDTKHPGMIYMHLGFNIGIKRNRINTFK